MKAVAVYNIKGGVGKSTTAVNLSYCCASSGTRTLLWDLDAQAASTFAFRVRPHVVGFGKKWLQSGSSVGESIKATDHDNLDLLPADFAYRKLDRFLERLPHPERGLAEVLADIGRDYSYVFLDCPPGFSRLVEGAFAAADVLLVPTIPTVLSLRTLGRIAKYFASCKSMPTLLAFLSMVDRRKGLHRRISEWSARHPQYFLSEQIPYASVIEQMTVHRRPLPVYAPGDGATRAYEAMWHELRALPVGRTAATSMSPPLTAFRHAIDELIVTLTADEAVTASIISSGEAFSHPPDEGQAPAPQGTEFRLTLKGDEDVTALLQELSEPAPVVGPLLVSHYFDTEAGDLHRNGYALRLDEQQGRFIVVAEGPAALQGRRPGDLAAESAQIDGRWAQRILSGVLCPFQVLERRLGRQFPGVIDSLGSVIGDRPLRRTDSVQSLLRRVGPVVVPARGQHLEITFEFARIEGSRGKVGHQVVAMASHAEPGACGQSLRELFARAGVEWRPRLNPFLI